MPLEIVQSDIVSTPADAIVYAETKLPFTLFNFNPLLLHPTGKELIKSREKLGQVANGDAKIVPASMLDAKYIIHTSAPAWHGGLYHELKHLYSCYTKVFELALEHQCNSIIMPIIASDGLGYPKQLSQKTAFECIRNFISEHDLTVYLAIPKRFGIQLPGNQYSAVDKFLDKNYVEKKEFEASAISDLTCNKTFTDFSEFLYKWMDKKGMNESELCLKGNLSKEQFLESIHDPTCKLQKRTVAALGISLELTLDEMKDLMQCAGYEMTPHSKFDLIIEYCLSNNIYDVLAVNMILFRFDQELLGGSNF